MKTSKVTILCISSLMFLALIVINNIYYANVIKLNVILTLLIVFLIILKYIQNKTQLFVTFILALISSVLILIFSIPSLSYHQASKLVAEHFEGNVIEDSKRNIPIHYHGFNVLKPTRQYRIVLENNGEKLVYRVNPNTGDILVQETR